MLEIIRTAIAKGAEIYPNVSGGKDGQALVKTLHNNGIPMAGFVHADLGRIEWKESHSMCENLAAEFGVKLHVVSREDGRGMIEHWKDRMMKLAGTGKPFWSSKSNRYCTSDMKRDVINKFYRSLDCNLIISAEGIRAKESKDREMKSPLSINWRITSSYYEQFIPNLKAYQARINEIKNQAKKKNATISREAAAHEIASMEVEMCEQALANYNPKKRLAMAWYSIFSFTTEEVWNTYGMTASKLMEARVIYKQTKMVPTWWPFHPAYVYGNERVSCVFCIMGCMGDLTVGAEHRPEILAELIEMEDVSGATFKQNFSLRSLVA